MDGEDCILAIVLGTEHLLDLAGLHFLIELIEALQEFGVDGLSCGDVEKKRIVEALFVTKDRLLPRDPCWWEKSRAWLENAEAEHGKRPFHAIIAAANPNSGRPNFMAVGAYDGMAAIYEVVRKLNGKIDGDQAMAVLKNIKLNSPRGPIAIDPETRDIIQPEYLREVKKVNGQLANVEIETLGTAVKDPWKELQKKK